MSSGSFRELVDNNNQNHRAVCAGLDPTLSRIPKEYLRGSVRGTLATFLREITEPLVGTVGYFKPNLGFYLAHGSEGIGALEDLFRHLDGVAPDVVKILDLKNGDIGPTCEAYAQFAFDVLGADAVTLHNYMGVEAMKPWLNRGDKGAYVLVRTTNPGAEEFQRLGYYDPLITSDDEATGPLYERVAQNVCASDGWNFNGNIGVVAGASPTAVGDLAHVRAIIGDTVPILIPGVGPKQGGDAAAAFENGANSDGAGIAVNSSSGITHAHDAHPEVSAPEASFIEATALHESIEGCRLAAV